MEHFDVLQEEAFLGEENNWLEQQLHVQLTTLKCGKPHKKAKRQVLVFDNAINCLPTLFGSSIMKGISAQSEGIEVEWKVPTEFCLLNNRMAKLTHPTMSLSFIDGYGDVHGFFIIENL